MENVLYCLLAPFLGSVIKYLSKSRVKKKVHLAHSLEEYNP